MRWILNVDLIGKHTTASFQEISGEMPGSTASQDLARWRATLRLANGSIDLEELDVWNQQVREYNNHMVLDLHGYDKEQLAGNHCSINFARDPL